MAAARVCCSLLALAAGSSATMPPGFGWGTLPTHWFSANVSSQISAEAAERIAARHSLVIFNGQSHAYKAAPFGKGSEGKMVEGGRMIRAAAGRLGIPSPSVLAYFNSVVGWTAYDMVTWLTANKTRLLRDTDGQPHVCRKDGFGNELLIPDLSLPEVRAHMVQVMAQTGTALDGIFLDRGDPKAPATGHIDPAKVLAVQVGHELLIHELRRAMPDKLYLLNDHTTQLLGNGSFPAGFDHEYESFSGSLTQIQQLQNDSAAGVLATAHTEGDFNTTLAAFLLGAGENAYFGATFQHGEAGPGDRGWSEPAWDGVRPEYTKKLGAPLGLAQISADGRTLTRSFKSGTKVVVASKPNATDSQPDSLGFIVADINNVAGEVGPGFPAVHLAGKLEAAKDCEALCAKNSSCLSYTWCGPSKGSYALDCFLRSDQVWQLERAHLGTTSGCKAQDGFTGCAPAESRPAHCVYWSDGTINGPASCHS
jgi:hypothetical protein